MKEVFNLGIHIFNECEFKTKCGQTAEFVKVINGMFEFLIDGDNRVFYNSDGTAPLTSERYNLVIIKQ